MISRENYLSQARCPCTEEEHWCYKRRCFSTRTTFGFWLCTRDCLWYVRWLIILYHSNLFGIAEQMDVHEGTAYDIMQFGWQYWHWFVLGTATVCEAMHFSTYLQQPQSIGKEEKNQYVEEMIELLELQDLSEVLVFSLNVEAWKRLMISVKLASKPELLLFLNEPTFGLDAQRYSNHLYLEWSMVLNMNM